VAAAFTAFGLCCALLTAGLTGWVEHHAARVAVDVAPQQVSGPVAVADTSDSLARIGAVQPLLDHRAAAVRTGRRSDWDRTLDASPAGRIVRARQLAEYDRLRLLPVRRWQYQLLETGAATGPAGEETFAARVRLGYRLTGDTRDVERVQVLTIAHRGAGWVVAAVRREGAEADPWELGPLTVLTGRRGVVVGIGHVPDGVALRRVVREVDDAAARVDAVWGPGTDGAVVVLVPGTQQQLAAVLGRGTTSGLDQIAAVTNGELTRDATAIGGVADRVVLNPAPFGRLSPLGRRVVLTHELTHVATRAVSRVTLPLWVEEGFANYVAYRGSGLSRSLVAADVLPLVRAGTAEDHLPEAAAFDPADGAIAPAYADAWLAFDLMAGEGTRRPVEFYRLAAGLSGEAGTSADRTLPAAFERVLGTDRAGFETRWRAYRAALAEGRQR
jgi:hypothetical protein